MDRERVIVRLGCSLPMEHFAHASFLAPFVSDVERLPRAFRPYFLEPLSQRPPGSIGKLGICRLVFRNDEGETYLSDSYVAHPFHFAKPWHLDPALPGMAVVYVQNPAGGWIQGDRASVQVRLGPEARVHVTNQAAEKIHSMSANCAVQTVEFRLDRRSYAEYCPDPVILFSGARFAQEVRVTLAEDASLFLSEVFLNRTDDDNVSFDALSNSLTIYDDSNRLIFREHGLVQPTRKSLEGQAVLGRSRAWGQALLVGPKIPKSWSAEIQEALNRECAGLTSVLAGVSVLPEGRGICIKVVAEGVRAARMVLRRAWQELRIRHLGVLPPNLPK